MTLRPETRVRARALQVLYILDMHGVRNTEQAVDAVANLTGDVETVIDDVEPMVMDIMAKSHELDTLAQAAADNWRFERIAIVERNILRIAIHELRGGHAPPKVVIDEALWLAHRFAGPRAAPFINGVLDRVARDLNLL